MQKDCKSDDIYITQEFQLENEVEPVPIQRDNLAPVDKTKLKMQFLKPPQAKPQSEQLDLTQSLKKVSLLPNVSTLNKDKQQSGPYNSPKTSEKNVIPGGYHPSPSHSSSQKKGGGKIGYKDNMPTRMTIKTIEGQEININSSFAEPKSATGSFKKKGSGRFTNEMSGEILNSRESARQRISVANKLNNQLDIYQAQVQQIDWKHPTKDNETEDDPLAEKLAELRIEVQKRDVLRKIEAMQNQNFKNKFGRGTTMVGSAQMQNQFAGLTTDFNGNPIQVRNGAVPLQ